MFKKIELGTLLLYQNDTILVSLIGKKKKKIKISPIYCINAIYLVI